MVFRKVELLVLMEISEFKLFALCSVQQVVEN